MFSSELIMMQLVLFTGTNGYISSSASSKVVTRAMLSSCSRNASNLANKTETSTLMNMVNASENLKLVWNIATRPPEDFEKAVQDVEWLDLSRGIARQPQPGKGPC